MLQHQHHQLQPPVHTADTTQQQIKQADMRYELEKHEEAAKLMQVSRGNRTVGGGTYNPYTLKDYKKMQNT